MNQTEQNPLVDIKVTVVNGKVTLSFNIPFKWLSLIIASFILWRVPELWKAIETAFSLYGK